MTRYGRDGSAVDYAGWDRAPDWTARGLRQSGASPETRELANFPGRRVTSCRETRRATAGLPAPERTGLSASPPPLLRHSYRRRHTVTDKTEASVSTCWKLNP